MTPRRGIVLVLAIVLGIALAVGMWGEPPVPTLSDDDYVAIALSQPQVFHATPGGRSSVSARVVDRGPFAVTVEVTSGAQRYRVVIDPRTRQVTQVTPQ